MPYPDGTNLHTIRVALPYQQPQRRATRRLLMLLCRIRVISLEELYMRRSQL